MIKATKAVAVPVKKRVMPISKPKPKPVEPGQQVFLSVLPKMDLSGNLSDCSPRVFTTREAAQADCDYHNKGRMAGSQFIVRDMYICGEATQ